MLYSIIHVLYLETSFQGKSWMHILTLEGGGWMVFTNY